MTGQPAQRGVDSSRPFQLARYFSLTSLLVLAVFTFAMTWFFAEHSRRMILAEAEEKAIIIAEKLNMAVFFQFFVPTVRWYGYVLIREPGQFELLNQVVKNSMRGTNIVKVNLVSMNGTTAYSTDWVQDDRIFGVNVTPIYLVEGFLSMETPRLSRRDIERAVRGGRLVKPVYRGGWLNLVGDGRGQYLRAFIPVRVPSIFKGQKRQIAGVFDITLDISREYREIRQQQLIFIGVGLLVTALIFVFLRAIVIRGERILERRTKERQKLEEQLNQAERLATLGRMIAAVSHEIRNPLGIIRSTAELMAGRAPGDSREGRLVSVIIEESSRLNRIVTEFLDFARPQRPDSAPCRVEDVLDRNLTFLAPELDKHHIKAVRRFTPDPQSIIADQDLLYRAFLNLFVNAIQAMPRGGTITVGTSPLANGAKAVTITDTGDGIDPEVREKIFTPFFTTKEKGSGLGLAIVHSLIVEEHRGRVSLESQPGKGTTVRITLPVEP
ncbi:MAG: two-component sensor histidine kinase [Proteobacteria bacterium]|nr:two-component sensor histidine kinase [Pseudomonadota bacterium]